MHRSMKDIWLSNPEDITPRADCAPIDWRPFHEQTILNGHYLLRAIRATRPAIWKTRRK